MLKGKKGKHAYVGQQTAAVSDGKTGGPKNLDGSPAGRWHALVYPSGQNPGE
jgi:hypothetical protein